MLASGLGKKLKEARLAKKMTQAEVVGNFITRNMLSQIESGAAMPSVKTLSYLAGVLDIPLSELMKRWTASKSFRKQKNVCMPLIIPVFLFYAKPCRILSKMNYPRLGHAPVLGWRVR